MEADLFALDATVIELSLALCPWARWKKDHASVKLNVLLDLREDLPIFASLHEGERHEVASLDDMPVYPGSYYVMDRAYMHFLRLYRLHRADAFFVTRLKSGVSYYVVESRPVDETVGLRCDQTIRLNSRQGRKDYPEVLRRISYIDPESGQALVFLTNQFELAALVIAQIYRRRWGIELFWRLLKQHLRLRGFFSNDPNGVRVQIWTALCAYLLVAITHAIGQHASPQQARLDAAQTFPIRQSREDHGGEVIVYTQRARRPRHWKTRRRPRQFRRVQSSQHLGKNRRSEIHLGARTPKTSLFQATSKTASDWRYSLAIDILRYSRKPLTGQPCHEATTACGNILGEAMRSEK